MPSRRFRQLVKSLLPPILADFARSGKKTIQLPGWEYAPQGWATKSPLLKGWNIETAVAVQVERFKLYQSALGATRPVDPISSRHHGFMSYAYVLALASRKNTSVSLLDYGGGIGYLYLISKALFPEVQLDYYCYDLPLFREAGRKLLPHAKFPESLEECINRKYDAVISIGSLLYVENWKETLTRLCDAANSYLYVTLPVIEDAGSYVALWRLKPHSWPLQSSTPESECLAWILNRAELMNCIAGTGMELVREFALGEMVIHNAPVQPEAKAMGFLFSPRSSEVKSERRTMSGYLDIARSLGACKSPSTLCS